MSAKKKTVKVSQEYLNQLDEALSKDSGIVEVVDVKKTPDPWPVTVREHELAQLESIEVEVVQEEKKEQPFSRKQPRKGVVTPPNPFDRVNLMRMNIKKMEKDLVDLKDRLKASKKKLKEWEKALDLFY